MAEINNSRTTAGKGEVRFQHWIFLRFRTPELFQVEDLKYHSKPWHTEGEYEYLQLQGN